MKLALGTAQFGMKYGVANHRGMPPLEEVGAVLDRARASGIDLLDTAAAYGCSEKVLGEAGLTGFRVISKVPDAPASKDVAGWIEETVEQSLERLKVSSLYGVLLHNPAPLLEDDGDKAFTALLGMKAQGVVRKVGVSVYGPDLLPSIMNRYAVDIVQAPMNIMDRRLEQSGWLETLKKSSVEVHIRSAFLQGLLLMNAAERPDYFNRWSPLFDRFEQWLMEARMSPLDACLRHLKGYQSIDNVVVGVDCARQLDEIVGALQGPSIATPSHLQSSDEGLINPSRWRVAG